MWRNKWDEQGDYRQEAASSMPGSCGEIPSSIDSQEVVHVPQGYVRAIQGTEK